MQIIRNSETRQEVSVDDALRTPENATALVERLEAVATRPKRFLETEAARFEAGKTPSRPPRLLLSIAVLLSTGAGGLSSVEKAGEKFALCKARKQPSSRG